MCDRACASTSRTLVAVASVDVLIGSSCAMAGGEGVGDSRCRLQGLGESMFECIICVCVCVRVGFCIGRNINEQLLESRGSSSSGIYEQQQGCSKVSSERIVEFE